MFRRAQSRCVARAEARLVGRGSRKTLEFPGVNRCFVVEIRSYAKMRAEPWFARGRGSARSQTSPTIRKVCTGALAKPIRLSGASPHQSPYDSRCWRAKVLLLARFPQKLIEHHRRLPGRDSSTNNPRHVGSAHSLIRLGSVFVSRAIASLAIVASTGDSVRSLFQSVERPSEASWGTRVVRAAQPLIVAISSGDGFRDWRAAQAAR